MAKLTSSSRSVLIKWDTTFGLVDRNPVRDMGGYLAEFRSSVLLSATGNPSSVFAKSLGLQPMSARTYEASAVPLVTVRTAVDTGTSTRYKLRNPEMYAKIADQVAAVIRSIGSGWGFSSRHIQY